MKPFKAFHPFKLGVIMKAIASWSPTRLFSDPLTKGVWYDPSDFTTLFQDAAGTTPAVLEQPVGLMLDKSKNGVGTNGAKRVNLLTKTEQFDDTAWNKVAFNYSANTPDTLDPIGGNTADFVYPTTANVPHAVIQTVTGTATSYVATIAAKTKPGSAYNWLRFGLYNGSSYTALAWFNVSTGQVGTVTSGTTITPTNLGNGWWRFGVSGALATSASCEFNLSVMGADGGSSSYAGDGTSGIYIWGADLRLASEASTLPTYQRIAADWPSTMAGNHAFNPTTVGTVNFPVLSARYNLLTKTEQFDDAVWEQYLSATKSGTSVCTINFGSGTNSAIYQTVPANSVSTQYTYSATVKSSTGKKFRFALYIGGSTVLYSPDITTTANFVTYSHTFPANALTGSPTINIMNESAGGTGQIEVKQPDLRVANDALNQPAYQRVNTPSDYDTVGFKPYLAFNGVNQWLQTNSIDFTYGDKMFVSAGVRKLSDAAQAVVAETGTTGTDNGSFTVSAPRSATLPSIGFRSRGTIESLANNTTMYASPVTVVASGIGDISGDQAILRVNGTQAAISTADQGTGNYGNYPLYIGSRGGASLWFNGRLYGLVFAGKQASAAEITSTEAWLNQKTGAY